MLKIMYINAVAIQLCFIRANGLCNLQSSYALNRKCIFDFYYTNFNSTTKPTRPHHRL